MYYKLSLVQKETTLWQAAGLYSNNTGCLDYRDLKYVITKLNVRIISVPVVLVMKYVTRNVIGSCCENVKINLNNN